MRWSLAGGRRSVHGSGLSTVHRYATVTGIGECTQASASAHQNVAQIVFVDSETFLEMLVQLPGNS